MFQVALYGVQHSSTSVRRPSQEKSQINYKMNAEKLKKPTKYNTFTSYSVQVLENIFLLKRKWIKVHGNNRPGVAWPYEPSPLSVRVRFSSGYAGVDTTHTHTHTFA